MIEAIVLSLGDNIGVALVSLKSGANVKIHGQESWVKIIAPIPYQHKFSVAPIDSGMEIIKDGVVIGKASRNIRQGQHVHIHNMVGLRLRSVT